MAGLPWQRRSPLKAAASTSRPGMRSGAESRVVRTRWSWLVAPARACRVIGWINADHGQHAAHGEAVVGGLEECVAVSDVVHLAAEVQLGHVVGERVLDAQVWAAAPERTLSAVVLEGHVSCDRVAARVPSLGILPDELGVNGLPRRDDDAEAINGGVPGRPRRGHGGGCRAPGAPSRALLAG